MIYLSQLIDQKVWDGFGHVVGKIDDVMVNATEKSVPPLSALVLKAPREQEPDRRAVNRQPVAQCYIKNRSQ